MSDAFLDEFEETGAEHDSVDDEPGDAEKKRPFWQGWITRGRLINAAIIGLVTAGLGVILWPVFVGNPLGGEPIAYLEIAPPGKSVRSQKFLLGRKHLGEQQAQIERALSVDMNDPEQVEAARRRQLIGGVSLPPDPELMENSEHGPLPRIGPDGRRPSVSYARPFMDVPDALTGRTPHRIAIMITGLGISSRATDMAIRQLPGEVSLAFNAYGIDLKNWVLAARRDGHEAFLQLPMEPFDYPDNDPGPNTLQASASYTENIEHLHWALGRFPAFVGVTNAMGAKFTASEAAFAPVVRELAKRGLSYVDDGSSPRSIHASLAQNIGLPFIGADVVIDAGLSDEHIDAALQRLERIGRSRGHAIGVARSLPLSINRLRDWLEQLEKKGFQLVPISALLKNTDPEATRAIPAIPS